MVLFSLRMKMGSKDRSLKQVSSSILSQAKETQL